MLAFTASLLARESKGLLIGERADPRLAASIETLAISEPGVAGANGIITVHLAPQQIEAGVARLEQRGRERHPQVVALFVKPQTCGSFERSRRALRRRGIERGAIGLVSLEGAGLGGRRAA